MVADIADIGQFPIDEIEMGATGMNFQEIMKVRQQDAKAQEPLVDLCSQILEQSCLVNDAKVRGPSAACSACAFHVCVVLQCLGRRTGPVRKVHKKRQWRWSARMLTARCPSVRASVWFCPYILLCQCSSSALYFAISLHFSITTGRWIPRASNGVSWSEATEHHPPAVHRTNCDVQWVQSLLHRDGDEVPGDAQEQGRSLRAVISQLSSPCLDVGPRGF